MSMEPLEGYKTGLGGAEAESKRSAVLSSFVALPKLFCKALTDPFIPLAFFLN